MFVLCKVETFVIRCVLCDRGYGKDADFNMKQGRISIYTGDGHGKSPAALGCALQAACKGQRVVIIQFLKGKGLEDSEFARRLEPEIKIFRFEKADEDFASLDEAGKKEAIMDIKNGMNFARKVIATGECDLLILDEVLGLIDKQIITEEELKELMSSKQDDMSLILTGITPNENISVRADEVAGIQTVRSAED